MIHAAHCPKDSLALTRDIPRKTDAWLPAQARYLSEAARNGWVGCQRQPIERIACFLNKGADERRVGKELTGSWISSAPADRWTGRGWSELHGAAVPIEHWRYGWVEAIGIEIRGTIVALAPWQVVAHAQAVVQRHTALQLPLILAIPLKEPDLQVRKWTRAAFSVASEIPDKRVGICITGVTQCGREGAVCTAKVEGPCPVSARRFSISDVFEIH